MQSRRRRPAPHRSGLTIIEVIVATAIFLGALGVIIQIMNLGDSARVSASLDAEAALRCESVMGEIVSGVRTMTPVSQEPFDDSDRWKATVLVEDGGGESLMKITVITEHAEGDALPNSRFQLIRYMRDPQLFLDAAMTSGADE